MYLCRCVCLHVYVCAHTCGCQRTTCRNGFSLSIIIYFVCMCICACVCMCACAHTCGCQRTLAEMGFLFPSFGSWGIELRTLSLASKFLGRPSHIAGHKQVKKAKRILGAERGLRNRSPKGCRECLCERKLRNPSWGSVEDAAIAAALKLGCALAKCSVGWRGEDRTTARQSTRKTDGQQLEWVTSTAGTDPH